MAKRMTEQCNAFPVRYVVMPMQFLGCGGKFYKVVDTLDVGLPTISRFMRSHWAHMIAALLNKNEGYVYPYHKELK